MIGSAAAALAEVPAQTVRLILPEQPGLGEEALIGIWRGTGPLQVEGNFPAGWAVERGGNWLLASTRLRLESGTPGLVHQAQTGQDTVAFGFKGYLLDDTLHQWSPASHLEQYWTKGVLGRRHNGVFAAAVISAAGQQLELLTDAFGVSPLYYRQHGDVVLFSTSPRYLTMPGDKPDLFGGGWLCTNKQLVDDRSLIDGVARIPAGTVLRFQNFSKTSIPWFRLADLPPGTKPLDEQAVGACEEVFQAAMGKVLRLGAGTNVLPLSSGDDSRRILSGLLKHKAAFEALTVRTLHGLRKDPRDYDAHHAAKLAAAYNFQHRVIDLPDVQHNARLDADRQLLAAWETTEHQWFMALAENLPQGPALLLDGAGGDVFGNTGFGVASLYEGTFSERLAGCIQHTYATDLDPIRISKALPSRDAMAEDLTRFFAEYPDVPNMADYYFLAVRTRRGPALKQQTLKRPGVITVCPFYDLDHVEVTMAYAPTDKLKQTIQSRCLQTFWSDLYAMPGSRRNKDDYAPPPVVGLEEQKLRQTGRDLLRRRADWDWSAPPLNQVPLQLRMRLALARLMENRIDQELWWLQGLTYMSSPLQTAPAWEGIAA